MWGSVSRGFGVIGLGWDRPDYVRLRAPFRAPPDLADTAAELPEANADLGCRPLTAAEGALR
jgi:hypothetical protein